jgi:type IV pilus assembly protein PilX
MNLHYQKQTGVALVISLIMLVLLTIIGMTGMQVTGLEEKMSGNNKEHNVAFQTAEVTLRDAEAYLESLATLNDFDDSQAGFISEATADPDYYADSTWNATNSATGTTVSGVATTPRYIIKHVGAQGDSINEGLVITGVGEGLAGSAVTIFRVTSSSTGNTGISRVILQSYYGKRF